MDRSFPERSALQVADKMELLDICLTTTYFQFEDKFYKQKEGKSMGSSLSPMVSNIFMKHFEEIALDKQTTNPLNASDRSTTLLLFGHMDQQDYSNFTTTSTTLDLPSNAQLNLKLMILFHSLMPWS
jgi:hypothetical protein